MCVEPRKGRISSERVLIHRREGCTVFDRGALLTIRRAPFDAAQIAELRHAIVSVAETNPRSVVMIVFRLEKEFPVAEHHLTDFEEFGKFMRAVDTHVAAHAVVLEFGGVRAAAMRFIGNTVVQLVRPRGPVAFFERITEAASWLAPHARTVGAPDDLATYVRCYREADALLEPLGES